MARKVKFLGLCLVCLVKFLFSDGILQLILLNRSDVRPMCGLSRSVLSDSLLPHGLRLLCLWDFTGKNTEVVCHFFISDPGTEPLSPASPVLAGGSFTTAPPGKSPKFFCSTLNKLSWALPSCPEIRSQPLGMPLNIWKRSNKETWLLLTRNLPEKQRLLLPSIDFRLSLCWNSLRNNMDENS